MYVFFKFNSNLTNLCVLKIQHPLVHVRTWICVSFNVFTCLRLCPYPLYINNCVHVHVSTYLYSCPRYSCLRPCIHFSISKQVLTFQLSTSVCPFLLQHLYPCLHVHLSTALSMPTCPFVHDILFHVNVFTSTCPFPYLYSHPRSCVLFSTYMSISKLKFMSTCTRPFCAFVLKSFK